MNATFLCFSPCFAENKDLPKKKAVDYLRRGRLACRNIFFLSILFSFTLNFLPSTNCVGGKQYKTNHQHLDGYEGRQQNGIRMSLCAHGKRNDSPAFAFNFFTYLLLSTCLSLCIWGNLHHLMFLFLCQTCPMCFCSLISNHVSYGPPVIVG